MFDGVFFAKKVKSQSYSLFWRKRSIKEVQLCSKYDPGYCQLILLRSLLLVTKNPRKIFLNPLVPYDLLGGNTTLPSSSIISRAVRANCAFAVPLMGECLIISNNNFIWVFFHRHSWFAGQQGKREGLSL